jgi:hypothetical protein
VSTSGAGASAGRMPPPAPWHSGTPGTGPVVVRDGALRDHVARSRRHLGIRGRRRAVRSMPPTSLDEAVLVDLATAVARRPGHDARPCERLLIPFNANERVDPRPSSWPS